MCPLFILLILNVLADSLEIDLIRQKINLLNQRLQSLDPERELPPFDEVATKLLQNQHELAQNRSTNLKKFKRDRSESFQVEPTVGERVQIKSIDSNILYYDFMAVRGYTENETSIHRQNQVILTLNSDQSFVVSSLSGRTLLKHKIQLDDTENLQQLLAPQTTEDPMFSILTNFGNLIVFKYQILDNAKSLVKYQQENNLTLTDFKGPVMVVVKQDVLKGVQQLLGKPNAVIEQGLIMNFKQQKHFVFACRDGWISLLSKNGNLKAQFDLRSEFQQMTVIQPNLVIGTGNAIAFTNFQNNSIDGYCEFTQVQEDRRILEIQVELQKPSQSMVYALTDDHQILVYKTTLNQRNYELSQCELLCSVVVPQEFHLNKKITHAAVKGAIILQNYKGQVAWLDTAAESLQQTPVLKVINLQLDRRVNLTDISIRQAKITDLNNKYVGSHLLVRTANSEIVLLEFYGQTRGVKNEDNSNANDWGFGGLGLFFAVTMGVLVFSTRRQALAKRRK